MDKRLPLSSFNIKTSFAPMEEMGFFKEGTAIPFEHDSKVFSVVNAWWMADFSRLSYVRNKTLVRKELKDSGFTKVKFFEDKGTGTQVLVASNRKTVVVSFRGTEIGKDFQDVVVDADAWLAKSKTKGRVHRGFQRALNSVWKDIADYLTATVKDRTLWFTGHSLGASLATIASTRYKATGTYTFGSPRVGNKTFIKTIKGPIYRIAKSNDIVTRVPPPLFYYHAGDLYFIDSEHKINKNPGTFFKFKERIGGSELKILWLLVKLIFIKSPWSFLLSYLHGHSPYNYSVFMWNNIDK